MTGAGAPIGWPVFGSNFGAGAPIGWPVFGSNFGAPIGSAGAVSRTEGRHADLCRAQADVLLKVSHAMVSVPRLPGKGGGTEVEARRRAFEELLKVQARRDVVLFGRRL